MSWITHLPRNLRIVVVLLALAGLVYATYRVTLIQAAPQLAAAKARIKSQKAEIRSLTSRLESSRTRREVAEQEASVMRQANQLLRETESDRQAELNRLQTELDFYQRLAGASGTQSGLAVYHLALTPTGSDRVFHYVLTLTQNLRRSSIVSGSVRFEIEGTLDDRLVKLPWSRLTDGSEPQPQFRFKYFQQLEGYLALPERFEPSRLLISLETRGQSKPVSRDFDWKRLTRPNAPVAGSERPANEDRPEKKPNVSLPD